MFAGKENNGVYGTNSCRAYYLKAVSIAFVKQRLVRVALVSMRLIIDKVIAAFVTIR